MSFRIDIFAVGGLGAALGLYHICSVCNGGLWGSWEKVEPSASASITYSTLGTVTTSTSSANTVNTDWAVSSVGLNPPNPQVGDSVTFKMSMTLESTTGSLPQTVDIQCQLDGTSCGSGSITYPGAQGQPMDVTASTPWVATAGTHTLTWSISTANDPNPANNMMSTTFTVQPAASTQSQTQTTSSQTSITNLPVTPVTVVQTQTVTQQPTSTQTAPPATTQPTTASQPDFLGMIQQNSLLVIAALGVLVLLLAVVALKHRGSKPVTSPPATALMQSL